jgi:hypothetical protein
VDVPAVPATVQPGDTVDWPHPIAGFEPVDEPEPTPAAEPSTPKSAKRAAASATTTEEQQA